MSRGWRNRRIAIECKASSVPAPTQGFWNALEDIGAWEAWIVALIEGSYPLARGVAVVSLNQLHKESDGIGRLI